MQYDTKMAKKITTQDNAREQSIIKYCGLVPNEQRDGIDCFHDPTLAPFETKSTTKKSKAVSTARDVHLQKINKWRSQYWVFGYYKEAHGKLEELYLAHPSNLELFFTEQEKKIKSKLEKCNKTILAASLLGVPEQELKLVKSILYKGTWLNDPSINWKLIQSSYKLPVDDSVNAQYLIYKYVKANPLPTKRLYKDVDGLNSHTKISVDDQIFDTDFCAKQKLNTLLNDLGLAGYRKEIPNVVTAKLNIAKMLS